MSEHSATGKHTTMTVEYECGHVYTVPLVLRDDQLLIANAALGDQMIGMIDATHDADHPECAEAPDGQR